ncbi:MAG: hypothetical protein D6679_10185 [Candidatus Hydrogenedentota bacterium]|nr:MAG: hypothetical protein D6679_10185 [Candidatus Hydrogenedentota bacterium]
MTTKRFETKSGRIRLLHIGYQKTGTSSLQDCRYGHPRVRLTLGPACGRLLWHFMEAEDAGNLEDFENRLLDTAGIPSGYIPVLSWERLSGEMVTGRFWRRTAERVRRAFPAAKILITIREQSTMVESIYSQYVKMGGSLSVKEFLSASGPFQGALFRRLKYDRLVGLYRELFGPSRVFVVLYEDLCHDVTAFLGSIWRFAGWDGVPEPAAMGSRRVNPRLGTFSLLAARRLNSFFSPGDSGRSDKSGWLRVIRDEIARGGLDRPLRIPWRLPAGLRKELRKRFISSNGRLAGILGEEYAEKMARYGYALAERRGDGKDVRCD